MHAMLGSKGLVRGVIDGHNVSSFVFEGEREVQDHTEETGFVGDGCYWQDFQFRWRIGFDVVPFDEFTNAVLHSFQGL